MVPRLGFICVVVDDMARSLTFYEHLGFKFPTESFTEPHVEAELPGGVKIYWDLYEVAKHYAPDYRAAAHGRTMLAFELDTPADVDKLFRKLTELGYKGDRTPWDAPWGMRYAIVYDPDGNAVDLFSPHS